MTSLLTPPQPTVPRHLGLLGRIGRSSARHPRRVIVSWAIVVLAAAPLAITMGSALSGAGWDAQGSTAAEVRAELRKDFPQLGAEAAIVAYRQPAPIADDPSGLILLVASLEGSPGTASDRSAGPAPGAGVDQSGRAGGAGAGRVVRTAGRRTARVGRLVDGDGGIGGSAEADTTGEWAVWHDFNETNEQALHKAKLLSGLPTLILLFIAFGSAIAAGIPLILAVSGNTGRFRSAPSRYVGDAAVGVVDELLDDDRPRRRDRLRPVHRFPIPRGTRLRARRDGGHLDDVGHGRQSRVPVRVDRGVVAGGDLHRADHGVSVDGVGDDPVGRGDCCRFADPAARRAGRDG